RRPPKDQTCILCWFQRNIVNEAAISPVVLDPDGALLHVIPSADQHLEAVVFKYLDLRKFSIFVQKAGQNGRLVRVHVVKQNHRYAVEVSANQNAPPRNLAFGCREPEKTVDGVLPVLPAVLVQFIENETLGSERVEKEVHLVIPRNGSDKGHVSLAWYTAFPLLVEGGVKPDNLEIVVLLTAYKPVEDQSP